jgi:hypothetical protein
MKCPHCQTSIGLFSRTVNSWEKNKVCPQCNGPIEFYMDQKVSAILFVPAVAVALLLGPVLVRIGLSDSIAIAVGIGLILLPAQKVRVRR